MHMRKLSLLPLLTLAVTAGGALAQDEELPITFITDIGADVVYRAIDENDDFDYNDAGETVVFYDSAAAGATVPLSDPIGITTSPDDFLYVIDSTEDLIACMEDLDDDGDCHGAGENSLYFDGTAGGNAAGIRMAEPRGIVTVDLGVLWVANVSSGGADPSIIIRLEDTNADLDANDANEARAYYTPTTSGSPLDSRPTAIEIGEDEHVYYVENGSTGVHQQGIYRLVDLDMDGTIQEATERTAFFLPPVQLNPMDLIALDVTRHEDEHGPGESDGDEEVWFLLDAGNDIVWRLVDENEDGVIGSGESWPLWSVGNIFDLSTTEGEQLLAPDAADPARIEYAFDIDFDHSVNPAIGENLDAYHDDVNFEIDMDSPYAIDNDFHGHEEVGHNYCVGTLCPCGNPGDLFGGGCANSTGDGALLNGEGTSGVALDDLAFHCTFLPDAQPALLFVGVGEASSGAGNPFNDGLLCVTGPYIRLGVEVATGGEAEFGPGLGAIGGWQPGDTRYFQVHYRDPVGSPCGALANMSNGVEVTFTQ